MEQRHDDDSIWAVARDAIFPPEAFAAAAHEVAACVGFAGLTGPSDVLDMPCGPGRHALPLARVGHRVVAVDRTRAYLDELRAAADPEHSLEVVEADMRDFVRPGAFDLALLLYNSLGYFDSPSEDRRLLENLWTSLRPGATLVIDLLPRELMTRLFEPVRERPLPDGRTLREEAELLDGGARLRSTWTLSGARPFDMSLRLYGADELADLLADIGLSPRLYGGFDGRPFEPTSPRMVVAARR